MLDPRIYRMGLVPVIFAVIVLAFSLEDQPAALSSNLAPDAYMGQNAYATMNWLARDPQYRDRAPGSPADARLAAHVASRLSQYHFRVSKDFFTAPTVSGSQVLENVVGRRAGLAPGTIALVTQRDSADLSGTAVLLELARLLSGETQHHTILLASTSGSIGAVGAARLARELPQPVDAVIVLGDLAGRAVRRPVVIPWSAGQRVAPTMLRNTVAGALQAQAGLPGGGTGLGGQLAHLAFPMTSSEQAPFSSSGQPAVLVSLSGQRRPVAGEARSLSRITGMGRAVLQAVWALDSGPPVPAPSAYVLWSDKMVPAWAIRLVVLALIAPVAAATVDALARARRRRVPVTRWVVWALAGAVPFAAAAAVVGVARVVGMIGFAPALPTEGGAVPLGASGAVLLALVGAVLLVGVLWLRPALIRMVGMRPIGLADPEDGAGAVTALLLILCVIAFVIWVGNPFAALLIVPALHLWMWAGSRRVPAPARTVLIAGGLVLPALVALYYAITLGLGPLGLAWSGALLLAGGGVGWSTAFEWSIFAGCALSAAAIAWRATRAPAPEPVPITIRGPISYAGPGSLGGTSSALRR